jgi:hypothetical protein
VKNVDYEKAIREYEHTLRNEQAEILEDYTPDRHDSLLVLSGKLYAVAEIRRYATTEDEVRPRKKPEKGED